ncbi:hypothetical protein PHISP_00022 [Aspergillus sp. HF37]|nr:hypothetical protein PHISP_00022 [Aspergillus sp. HF37]
MATWARQDIDADEKEKEKCDRRPSSSGGMDVRNVEHSVHNISLSLPDSLANPRGSPSPMARGALGSWYLCENEDLPVPRQPGSQEMLPPPYSEIGSDPEIVSPTLSLAKRKCDEKEPTPPASVVSQRPERGRGAQPARLKDAIDRMIESQSEVSAKRLSVRELRQGLKYKREEEGALRAAVMKKLNILSAQTADTTPLLPELEQLRSATNAYLDMERDYNQAEDELEEQEYAVFKSMKRLSDFLRHNSAPDAMEAPEFSAFNNADEASSTVSGIDEVSPSVAEYLSRVGDLRILQERLSELDGEWMSVTENQSLRQRVGIPMTEESLQFLHRYDEQRMQIQDEMNDVLLDINRLRAACDNDGAAMDQHAKGIDGLQLGEITQQPEDPLKTPAVGDTHALFEPGTSEQLSRTTFINKWILHHLRHSSVEIGRLKSLPELQSLEDEGWDEVNISRLALTMWFADDVDASSASSSPLESHAEQKEVSYNDDSPEGHKNDSAWEGTRPMLWRGNSDGQIGSYSPRRLRSLTT